jgi:hypothetical protein
VVLGVGRTSIGFGVIEDVGRRPIFDENLG